MQISLKNPVFTFPRLPPLGPAPNQIQNFIACAGKRRRQPFLNRKVNKLILDTALAVASNLCVIPPQVTVLIREFGGGGGGGGGFGCRRGGGGGGFGRWRRRARNLGFVVLVVSIGMGLCGGKKLSNDVVLCGIVFAVVGSFVPGFGDWVLGLSSCAVIVYLLGLKREQVSRAVGKLRACVTDSGMMKQLVKRCFKSKPF